MRRRTVPGALLVALALVGASCETELPERDSEAAALYRERCGSCHRPYQPSSLTAATWKMMLPRMEDLMRRKRDVRPLSPDDKKRILEYLERHARKGS